MLFAGIKILLGVIGIITFSVTTYKVSKAPIKSSRYDEISMGIRTGNKPVFYSGRIARTTGYNTSAVNEVSEIEVNYYDSTELLADDTELLSNNDETELLNNSTSLKDTELL